MCSVLAIMKSINNNHFSFTIMLCMNLPYAKQHGQHNYAQLNNKTICFCIYADGVNGPRLSVTLPVQI